MKNLDVSFRIYLLGPDICFRVDELPCCLHNVQRRHQLNFFLLVLLIVLHALFGFKYPAVYKSLSDYILARPLTANLVIEFIKEKA